MATPLTPKQRQFVTEYLLDLNATQAAMRAGYAANSADEQACRLLANAKIKAAVETAMEERMAWSQISQSRVLSELAHLAFSNVEHYQIDENGSVTLAEGAPRGAKRAISSIKRKRRTFTDGEGNTTVETEVEIKLWDKPSTLKLAGKHVGLFSDREKPEHDDAPTVIVLDTSLDPRVETVTTTTLDPEVPRN